MDFKMGKVVGKVLSEDNGNLSTMRILVFLIVAVILFNWTWFNIHHNVISSFDWQDLALIVGPLFAKAYQKSKEVTKAKV